MLKHSRYRPKLAYRVDRGIALPLRDLGARGGGWSAPHSGRFTPGKDPVPIVQEAGWAPGPVWTCANNLAPTGIRFPNRPARSQSLYRLSYPAHVYKIMWKNTVRRSKPQNRIWRMRIAGWITKATNTLTICNNYCFSTATVVTRKHFSVTFIRTSPSGFTS
jgi:hypothetical protein